MNFCRFLDCFLATSWHILGSSWRFLKTSSWLLTTFSPPELSSLLKIHQEATETPSRSHWDTVKKPLRHRQEANETQTRLLRYRQEVTRYVKSSRSDKISQIVTNIFEIFNFFFGASRFIKNCQEVSGSVRKCQEVVQEVSKKILGSVKTLSSTRFVLNFVKVGQL